eukprot:4531973-Alexandrium_andersonii.AAC.1
MPHVPRPLQPTMPRPQSPSRMPPSSDPHPTRHHNPTPLRKIRPCLGPRTHHITHCIITCARCARVLPSLPPFILLARHSRWRRRWPIPEALPPRTRATHSL